MNNPKIAVARAAKTSEEETGPSIMIHSRVTRTEHVRVAVVPGGDMSVGALVDDYFQDITNHEGVVDGFELEIAPEVFRMIYLRSDERG